jgi:hypothetical protein
MKRAVHSFFLLTTFLFIIRPGIGQTREEYNGPFASWADVKKLGATGNGKTDDTRAIQKAIDNLSNPATQFNMGKGAYMVLYFPPGVYCISSTLVLRGKIGVGIIGADPKNTIIKWIGKDKDTMLWANGSAYYRIARFTWDGSGKKEMEAVGIHWKEKWDDGKTKSFAPLNIEIADNYFIGNLQLGIHGGTFANTDGTGANDSEITIKRCVFEGCNEAAIAIHGWNALDYWIWDCQFLKCKIGVKNQSGNYHVYRSYFNGSTYCDLRNFNGYYTSMRGCYSENAYGFSLDDGVSCNPFKRSFQNNTVLNITKYPIEYYHIGKVTLWHNTFSKVKDKEINYWLHTGSWCPNSLYEVMSIKNRYQIKEPLWNARGPLTKFSIGDSYEPVKMAPTAAATFIKSLDRIPGETKRKVFDVPPGADARAIQQIINQAAALKGQRPVIHFGVGTWYVNKTLVIPKGSDLQLIGDGLIYASLLLRDKNTNFRNAPLILVEGPSYITIKDLQLVHELDHALTATVVFVNVDQPASEAHLDQIYSNADTTLVSENMDYLYIEKNNSFYSTGSLVKGGPLTKQGKGTARVCCYGGQFTKLSVTNGASFLAKDCWFEGAERIPLDLKGSGKISLDGAMLARLSADSTPIIRIADFEGKINIMNMYIQGAITVNPGNDALNLLVWNDHFYHKMYPYEYIKPGKNAHIALLGSNTQCMDGRLICNDMLSIPDKIYGINNLNGFIENMTAFDRNERPMLYRDLPAGASNIYMSRVTLGATRRGIVFSNQ